MEKKSMALRTFETNEAVYYLGLGLHWISNKYLFEEVDLSSLELKKTDHRWSIDQRHMKTKNYLFSVLKFDCFLHFLHTRPSGSGRFSYSAFSNALHHRCQPPVNTPVEKADFIVFEDSGFTQILEEISSNAHYGDLYAAAVQENSQIGIYGVDTAPFLGTMGSLVFESLLFGALWNYAHKTAGGMVKEKEKISRREMLKRSAIIGGAAALGATYLGCTINSLLKKEVPGVSELNSIKTTIFPTPLFAFRDAVTAKKISEYLVPKHKEKGRKVRAAIAAGALHSGIESKLKHPWIADKTIEFYHQFLGYAEKEELNEVRQLKTVNGSRLSVVTEDCGLF